MMSPIRAIELRGDPRTRGRIHGEEARDLIASSLEFYTEAFARQTGLGWDAVRSRAAEWLPICELRAPHLVDEARGIAEGAGVELNDIMALNIRGEIIYDEDFGGPAIEEIEGCTSFAIAPEASGDGHQYAGQNWDWRLGTSPTTLALRIVQDPLPTIIMQVEAGQIGRHGANSAGIALNANGLGGRFDNTRGLPQTFIRRMVLDQPSLDEALSSLVHLAPHIASNALLSSRGGFIIDIETTPQGVAWMYPTDGILVHGNHYQAGVPAALAGRYRPSSVDSLFRVPRATAGMQKVRGTRSPEETRSAIRDAMSDHLGYPESVCTHASDTAHPIDQWATVLSNLVDLDAGEYLLAQGSPCTHEYQALPWNILDGPAAPQHDTRTTSSHS